MTKGKFALGAIIGAVAGVVAGILTAPKAGKDTRADLKLKAKELKHEAAKKADDAKVQSSKIAENVKEKAEEYKDRGGRAVDGAIEGAKKGFYSKR